MGKKKTQQQEDDIVSEDENLENLAPIKSWVRDDDEGDDDDSDDEDNEEIDEEGEEGEEDGDDEDSDDEQDKEAAEFQRQLNELGELELKSDLQREKPAEYDDDKSEEQLDEEEEEIHDLKKPLPIPKRRERIQYILQVLANFKKMNKGIARADFMQTLTNDLCQIYDYSDWLMERFTFMFTPAELYQYIEASDTHRPETIRTNTLKIKRRDLAQALVGKNVNVDPLEKWSKEGLVIYDSQVAIGGTPEYLCGHYMLQAAASFLPVIALDPQENETILDMAAAPGGKTTHIAQRMKNSGILYANDISKDRVKALVANIHRLGVSNTVVTILDGKLLPKHISKADRVLLDAPCTGTGIVSKDPKVKITTTLDELYALTKIQKELLLAAIDCCDHRNQNNVIVYSTCSVLVDENELIVQYALKHRNVKLIDTGIPFGRPGILSYKRWHFDKNMSLCRRFYPHVHNLDGFFVAKLQKLGPSPQKLVKKQLKDKTKAPKQDGAAKPNPDAPVVIPIKKKEKPVSIPIKKASETNGEPADSNTKKPKGKKKKPHKKNSGSKNEKRHRKRKTKAQKRKQRDEAPQLVKIKKQKTE